jgi:ADP-heptose:LPS heptosyltransferase
MVGRQNVYFLVFQENRFILDAMDVIPRENVFAIPTRGAFSAAWGAWKAIRRIRRSRIDAALDFEFFARSSAILTYLSRAKRRVGLHAYNGEGPYRGDLMTHRLRFNPYLHISQTFQIFVEALNAPADKLPALNLATPPSVESVPTFRAEAGEVERVRQILLREMGGEELAPLVLLNANCSDLLPLRRWADENYVELARRLLAKYPELHIAFTGAPDEAAGVAPLLRQIDSPRCLSLAGKTTLRQLLVLYSFARVLVTNDSGPAHFAAITPVHVVALFGPETPELFGMRGDRGHAMWSRLPCSPCVNVYNNRRSACRDNLCLQRISADSVFETVCRLYESPGRNGQ